MTSIDFFLLCPKEKKRSKKAKTTNKSSPITVVNSDLSVSSVMTVRSSTTALNGNWSVICIVLEFSVAILNLNAQCVSHFKYSLKCTKGLQPPA